MKKLWIIPLLALVVTAVGCTRQDRAAPGPQALAEARISSGEPGDASSGPRVLDLAAPLALPPGVDFSDGVFTVTEPGIYRVSGACAGRLAVDAVGAVELVLSGVRLSGPKCLEVLSSDADVTLTAAPGTENFFSDGASAPDDGIRAAIYAAGPLSIGGSGAITVTAGANNGIQSKAGLTVSGGQLTVSAAGNALKTRGVLTVAAGDLTLAAGNDGLSAEAGRITEGSVYITGGTVDIIAGARGIDGETAVGISGGQVVLNTADDGIRGGAVALSGGDMALTAGGDGVQAETSLFCSGGVIRLVTGGGGGNAISHAGESFGPWGQSAAAETASTKGFKSAGSIDITGGTISFDTADDSIHCVTLCTIDGGDITICSSDDAIHCDDWLVINDGSIYLADCFEGLEAFAINVNGGDIIIRAVNDGVNANGPEGFGFPGMGSQQTVGFDSLSGQATTYYCQTGGSVDLVVTGDWNNVGDGVDSNGAFYMYGGVLTVSTRGDTMEGGIDIGRGELLINGGMVMAGGASMMQESVSESCAQCAAVISTGLQPAGTTVTILDGAGNEIWSHAMANVFNCLVLSHPGMVRGNVYTVTYGTGSTTLDFTDTNVINMRGGWGFRPF